MKKTEAAEKKTQEAWFEIKKPALWKHRAAGALYGWPVGAELTESEYLSALDAAGKIVLK